MIEKASLKDRAEAIYKQIADGGGKVGDIENKAPYDSAKWREYLENKYGAENVTSTTAPKNPRQRVNSDKTNEIFIVTDANGGKAIQMKFNDPVTGELKSANIPYNKRGLPVFDDHTKFTTTIDHSKKYDSQFTQATRDLRDAIKVGKVDSNQFNAEQLQDIKSGERVIEGFTWHHNADTGNMQLVPFDIHDTVKHIGQKSLSEGR
jgi:filamentous hemagglutinin